MNVVSERYEDDEYGELRTVDELSALIDGIERRTQALGPAVDAGREDAVREYISLNQEQMALVDERSRRRLAEGRRRLFETPIPMPTPVTTPSNERQQAEANLTTARTYASEVASLLDSAPNENKGAIAMELDRASRVIRELEQALPYVGVDDATLAEQADDAEVKAEEAAAAAKAFGVDDNSARARRARRDRDAAAQAHAQTVMETRRRRTETQGKEFLEQHLRRRAENELLEQRQAKLMDLSKNARFYPDPIEFEIERRQASMLPSEEQIATRAAELAASNEAPRGIGW